MSKKTETQIVPGLTVNGLGQASVDSALTEILCDLAIGLEESTDLPVDVEHVVAALLLASRDGELDAEASLRSDSPELMECLAKHVRMVFAAYGGEVGGES